MGLVYYVFLSIYFSNETKQSFAQLDEMLKMREPIYSAVSSTRFHNLKWF